MALLGAIAVIAISGMPMEEAARSVDLPTIALLFAFMVVSAQKRLGGFYTEVMRRMGALPPSRAGLLGALIGVAGVLSAIFSNDITCLAMTPVVARLRLQRRLNPVPFLIGLACAANIGSAATLIGNPQNMLIGSVMQLPFGGYVRQALQPVALSLGLLWRWLAHGPGSRTGADELRRPEAGALMQTVGIVGLAAHEEPAFDRWQTAKGLAVATALMGVFVADLARQQGVALEWKPHPVTGMPVTLATLAIVWAWMALA